jgi:hypothetical protein
MAAAGASRRAPQALSRRLGRDFIGAKRRSEAPKDQRRSQPWVAGVSPR